MYVCEKSRQLCTLCESRTILVFQIRTQKLHVFCVSLVSVILQLFSGIFLISTFPLDMAPIDIIKVICFSSHLIENLSPLKLTLLGGG